MKTPMPRLLFAAALLGSTGCDDDLISPGEARVDLAFGRVFDARALPARGIQVRLEPAGAEATTAGRGHYTFEDLAAGPVRIVAGFAAPVERCLRLSAAGSVDLGDLYEGMPSSCGVPAGCAQDQDCDGLADALEREGWLVRVQLGDRSMEERRVFGDPAAWDSDEDGLDDGREYAAMLDPGVRDTDGDLLPDYAELVVFHSSGLMVDTDGDACPGVKEGDPCLSDPDLWDGFEVELSRTSPTLADTDGDGLSDFFEINVGGTNPRRADLPQLDLEIFGDPLIEVDVDYQTGQSRHQQELARNEEEQVDTDSTSTKMSIENTVALHTEAEAGTGTWPPSFTAKLTTDTKFQHGYFHDTSSSWRERSVQESQQNYERWEKELVSFDDGKLSVALKVVNRSDLSFALDDLRIVAFRLDGGGRFGLIGTLQPDAAWGDGNRIMGPGGEATLTATLEHIGGAMMRALVRNPTAMTFEVGAYSLFQLDDLGQERTVNYAKLGESVVQRTGLIIIDFGDGRVERHLVATNVFRRPDGAAAGLPLVEALADLGVDYELATATSSLGVAGARVLSRVGDARAYDLCRDPPAGLDCAQVHPRGFWLVGGTTLGDAVDFEDLVLGRGERIHLVYNADTDGDGVFDREEYLLGTHRDLADSDADGLSDFTESKVGWMVTVQGREPYVAYSDPRFADIDGDFLSDQTELFLATDPYLRDTDGDGDSDTIDVDPLAPPCLDGESVGLMAWWDGSTVWHGAQLFAADLWAGEADQGLRSDGLLVSDDPAGMVHQVGGDAVFRLNQGVSDRHEVISVASDASISPRHELTVSAWIYWQGIGSGADWATILAKGTGDYESFKLDLSRAGMLRLSLRRSTHEKCWYCSFGADSLCDDRACRDSDYEETLQLAAPSPVPAQAWTHVAASFGGETMRLYVNGERVAQGNTSPMWWGGWFRYQRTTNALVESARPLRIGLDDRDPAIAPYRGLVDDVQVALRSLREDQVALMHQLGVCVPEP